MMKNELSENKVKVYQRKGSPFFQGSFEINNQLVRFSTKTKNEELARKFVIDRLKEYKIKIEYGIPLKKSRKFKEVAELVIKELEQNYKKHFSYIINLRNYLIPFFGDYNLENISDIEIEKWYNYRNEKYPNLGKTTIEKQKISLNKVFKYGIMHKFIDKKPMYYPKNTGIETRRASFSMSEYMDIVKHKLDEYIKKNDYNENLLLMKDLILILANTGIRYGTETYNLKFSDIGVYKEKNGDEFITMNVEGKTKKRQIVCRYNVKEYILRIASRVEELKNLSFTKLITINKPLFITSNGKPMTKKMYIYFNIFLEEYNMKINNNGEKRSLYSFRHFYITESLLKGIPIYFIAEQCGNSVRIIEKNYAHVTNLMNREILRGHKYIYTTE